MPPSEPPRERRKQHALRALYLRVDTLEKLNNDYEVRLAVLEAGTVKHAWLNGVALALAVAITGGAYAVLSKSAESNAASEKRSAAATDKLADKLDDLAKDLTETKIKAEATYLVNVEQRPRQAVKEEVQRKTEER